MDSGKISWLKQSFGDAVTFWGGAVSTQTTLAFGSVDDVRREARERVEVFGEGGGFVFCPDHNVQPGTSPEAVVALYETVHGGS